MTGLTAVLLSGLSGLRAAQSGLAVASQNIANANTPGFVRTELTLSARTQLGAGAGVEVTGVRRAADRFLATASYLAEAARGAASVRADILTRAQASFGDPASDTSLFASLDQVWSALSDIGIDPSSPLRRSEAINALQTTFSEVRRIGQAVQDLASEADQRISEAVSRAQDLMNNISALNREIQLNRRTGADASGAENAQSALIDQLSALMDVRATAQSDGSVHVRTSGGALLVGIQAARLSYTPSNAPFATHGSILVNEDLGTQSNLEPFLSGGEIKGLLQVRDKDLPSLAEALGGFSGALAEALNQIHNENTASPAPSELVGRQTGLLSTDALGFTGNTVIAVVDATGTLRQRLNIDFDTQTITIASPVASLGFAGGTIASLVTALNWGLGAALPVGSASFTDGVLSLNVGAGGGLVVQQDAADPSDRAGRGFSHFFGLNDVVSRPTPLFFENGVDGADLHGLNAGGEIIYQVRDSMGRFIADRTISIAGALAGPASTWNNLITALNIPVTGLGEFGAFALDAATGRISFTANSAFQVGLVADSTERGATGVSLTALHGMGAGATAGRAGSVDVNAMLAADPTRLAVGRPNLTLALGQRVIEGGDSRGAAALLGARGAVQMFPAAGLLSAQSATLSVYAARLGGEAGRLASDAKRGADGALAIATAAGNRRAEVEGVSLDDEMLRMTTFQNAYAAAARVIQAATEMLDVLMSIGFR